MRAGAWSTHRDIAAARVSWERARQIADALPDDDPGRTAMRIAPRTMLCGTGWRVDAHIAGHFRGAAGVVRAAGDKASLAIGMTGMVMDHMMHARLREASRLASEQMALLDSIGDPALTVGAGFMAILMKYRTGEIADVLRWSQSVIDWADGDPTKGNLIVGSPLAVALVWRGVARFWLGRHGWRQDLDDAVAMARSTDPVTHALVVFWKHGWTITNGVLLADDTAVRELDEALQIAERSGDDTALGLAKYMLGIALVHRDGAADHQRGLELLAQVRDMCLHQRFYRSELSAFEFHAARVRGPAWRPRWCHTGDSERRKRFLRGWTARVRRCRHRRSGGDAAGPWHRGRRGRSPERDRPCGEAAGRRRFGVARHHAAAAARPAGPRPRRRRCLPRLGGSLSRDGGITWLRRTHRDGRGDVAKLGHASTHSLSTGHRGKKGHAGHPRRRR